MKITRKAGQVALAGAIAFGGLGLGAVSDVPVPGLKTETAKAATNGARTIINKDWNGLSFNSMQANVERGGLIDNIIARKSYTTGATLGGIFIENYYSFSTDVKLYEITSNGTLKRWKTILPNLVPNSDVEKTYQYVTLITSVYPKGDYVAIHSFGWKYPGAEASEFQEYKQFTIN